MQKILFVITCSALFITCAFGQRTLTLEECLALAQKNSPALQAAEGELHSTQLADAELSTTALPQVKAAGGASYAPMPPGFGYDPAISNGGQLAAQVIVEQSIYDGGVRDIKHSQFQFDAERLKKERDKVKRDLVYSVRQSFIEWLRAVAAVQLENQSVSQLSDYRGVVERLYKGGSASYTDLLKTEVQLSTATNSLLTADEALVNARFALAELTNEAIDSTTSPAGSLDSLITIVSDSSSIPPIPHPEDNLDLGIAGIAIQHSLLDVELSKRELFPVISFEGDAGYLNSFESLRLPADQRYNAFGVSFGVAIELPLFNWGATDLRTQQRQLEVDGLRFQLEILKRSLNTQEQTTSVSLTKAKERLRSIRLNITKADENFLLTKSQYAGGVSLSLEVLEAQQLLTEAKLSELETLANIQLLSAKLEQLATK